MKSVHLSRQWQGDDDGTHVVGCHGMVHIAGSVLRAVSRHYRGYQALVLTIAAPLHVVL
jgi:hypothetical protein